MRRATAVPGPEDLERMYKASPVAHAHNAKVSYTCVTTCVLLSWHAGTRAGTCYTLGVFHINN